MSQPIHLHSGTVLQHHDSAASDWKHMDVYLAGQHIVSRQDISDIAGIRRFDASGLFVLPGLVDIHGDAFERQVQPRPGTTFSYDIAFADTDKQLIANGITTACHGLTYSWEGGLRGREAALALIHQLQQQKQSMHADHRLHLRFENHHTDGCAEALEWIEQGLVDFFAFNEHLPSILKKSSSPEKLMTYAERARCDVNQFLERLHKAQSRSTRVAQTIQQLAAACRQRGIAMASHDDETIADRERYQELGVHISEFPKTEIALNAARALGNHVIMGAPNVLLGGSHCGGLSATEAVRRGQCDILASDYYYPALLHAPFRLVQEAACDLAHAWNLVSYNPAQVLGCCDRGQLHTGARADVLLVEQLSNGTPRLIATIAAGKLIFCAQPERLSSASSYSMAA